MSVVGVMAGLVLAAAPAKPSPWAELARQDLQAMHQAILESHPGPVDGKNPGFGRWLEAGYRESLALAREARSFGGYSAAVRRYAAGFRDGHLGVYFTLAPLRVQWPGFLVAERQGRYVVAARDEADGKDLPALGSELRGCDGVAPQAMAERDALPYQRGADVEPLRLKAATALLVDDGNPRVRRPRECTVRAPDGSERGVTLRYRDVEAKALAEKQAEAAFGAKPDFGVRRFGDGGVWVSIPAFAAFDTPTLERLKALVAQAPEWKGARLIVFDVRGNGGGSSAWGDMLLEGLYGKAFYDARVKQNPALQSAYAEWRVSRDNLRHVGVLIEKMTREVGADAEFVAYLRKLQGGMGDAQKERQALYRVPDDDAPRTAAAAAAPETKARVFLLTDGRCASACLDFADRVLQLPDVTHVGRSTSADSVYMEVRLVELPSGAASLILPVKVYRDRPRGHNQPYVPQVRYDGDLGDTAAVQRWLEGLARR